MLGLLLRAVLKLVPSPFRLTIINLFRSIGFFYSRGYVPLSLDRARALAQRYPEAVKTYTSVHDSRVTTPPQHLSEDNISFIAPLTATTETVVLEVTHPGFSFRNNHLLDEQRNVIYQPDLEFQQLPIYQQILEPTRSLRGTVAYLSNTDTNNYYHWLAWILPLIDIYRQYVDLSAIDYFYLGKGKLTEYKIETLQQLGISRDRLITNGCKADRLLAAVCHRVGHHGDTIDDQTYQFSRSLYQDVIQAQPTSPRKRLYVARGDVRWRHVINEAEVSETLAKFGFETVVMDGRSVLEQAKLFAQAEAIVSVHGAALANLLFIQPHTKVIELFPYGYALNNYYALTSYGNADYYYTIGRQCQPTSEAGNQLNIWVDIDKLTRVCELACLGSSLKTQSSV